MYVISYQRYGIDSVEPANSVLQLLTRQPTQKIADGANAAHNHIDIHPRLQTRGERSQSQLSHYCMYQIDSICISTHYTCLQKLQSNTVGYVYERHSCPTGGPVFADLRSQQLRHLSVVAAEHLLQTQPERGGKVKVVGSHKTNLPLLMFSTNRHQSTHDPLNGCCCY